MNGWSWYWVAWIVLGFGIPEGYALATNAKNTLSWQVWDAESFGGLWVRVPVFIFCLWLLVHMVWRILK